jgi:uncharacterized secreted repeat protein (TIGR03808 family)
MRPTRRHILIGLAALPLASPARAQTLDLPPDSLEDQSGALQDALLRAAAEGRRLILPPGTYYAQNLQVPGGITIEGRPGASVLAAAGDAPVLRIAGSARVGLDGITVTRGNGGPAGADRGLVEIEASDHIAISNCTFVGGASNGLVVRDAAADITHCDFTGHALAAIFSVDSRGLNITSNSIAKCGNGGILIWGSQPRHDGSIISGNSITGIGATNGGNGQNGNGIYVFRSNNVIVSANQIGDCAFTAVRLNSTSDISVNGNVCRNSGDIAIVSEFAFSGTVIADNIIDGAAAGIAITNLENGGRLATCSGNIVRNIRERTETSPEGYPFGIYVEAETTVLGNTIDAVPGTGIVAGYGTFLRNVAITGNVLYAVHTGIAVSVVSDPAPGPVLVADNIITDPLENAIVGIAGDEAVTTDLVRDAAKYPHITLSDNRVTGAS